MNRIILIDGNSLINKAYYAMPTLMNKKGVPTGAVYGFLSMLNKMIEEIEPTHIVTAFDLKAPTFRHKKYSEYKAGRRPMPEDLAVQIPLLKEVLTSLGVKICQLEGYEADDILGTLSKRFNDKTYVISGDKDTLQLVSESTEVWFAKKGITDVNKVTLDKMKTANFMPWQVIEYKALAGDSSDNIKGVAGVGEKTARELLEKYQSIDGVYEHIDEIKGKLKEKLELDKDSAYFSRELATIFTEVPIDCTLDDAKFNYPFKAQQVEILQELEFTSLISRFKVEGEIAVKEEVVCEEEIVKDSKKLQEVLSKCEESVAIRIDKEISFALGKEKYYTLEVSEDLFSEGLTFDETINLLKPILENKKIEKVVYEAKETKRLLSAYNVELVNFYDVLLAGYVINSKNYKTIVDLFSDFGYTTVNVATYYVIMQKQKEEMQKQNLSSLYYDVELPLVNVLYSMEKEGVTVDINILNKLGESFSAELDMLTKEIYALVGEPFNINSPKQLGDVLFIKLGLKSGKKTKTGYSTGEEVLNKLVGTHPIIELILRYRKIAKLNSTYIEGMRGLVKGGKIHTTYQQTVTTTGRLSSTNPNLQNIPTRDSEGSKIREMFTASNGGYLVSADYSQIELRLLAHYAGDEKLIEAYNEEADIHARTASEIFGVNIKDVTKQMRRDAKAVNFGIIYGISGFGLASNLEIPRYKAQEYIDRYFETYPKVKEYMDKNVKFAKENGYVLTMLNRRRYIPEISSSNYQLRSFGERAAMNMPLQGSAADLIKLAMIGVYNRLNKEGLKAKLILQIHDELIIDCPKEEKETVKRILKEEMEGVAKLRVPLIADVGEGENWQQCK